MKKLTPIIWGIAIIALGIIFAGNSLNLFNINIFFKGWWTLFIIIPSIYDLFAEDHKFGSFFFLSVGVVLLLAAQEVFSYDVAWKVIGAILLILIGFSIIIKTLFRSKASAEVEKKIKMSKNGDNMDNLVAVFSGAERAYNGETFSGANLTAVFGGAELDLRKAKFDKDIVVRAFCMFGGIDIIVPDDVEIKTKSGFIFGGITDERKDKEKSSKYTLYIDAAGGFGGVTISSKP
ncbi:MAG: LiaF-related protein [Candidatus Saccharibacteria bacterium]|nr:LiaF-related protein [Candidatus Saccharibacteria bacterium]